MAKKYLNCREVVIKGKKMWRARLNLPYDMDLGYRPAPKDFYGATAAEADAKRKAYKPEQHKDRANKTFLEYLSKDFLPKQQQIAEAGKYSWQHYADRKRRLERFLLEPEHAEIKKLLIRRVRLTSLKPDQVKDFFHALMVAAVAPENRRKLKDDLHVALKDCRRKLPEPYSEYFEDVEVPSSSASFSSRKVFDWRQIAQTILDESKPLRDRALVGFAASSLRRPSEIFALKWGDVNWNNGTVPIEKRIVKTKDGMGMRDGTKNGVVGEIGVGAVVMNLLARLKQEPLPYCAECGESYSAIQHRPPFEKSQRKRKEQHHRFAAKLPDDNDFIFTTERGRPLNKHNFKWDAVKKNLELPDGPGFYSFKHMMNQALQERHAPVAAIANRMGHKNDKMARTAYRPVLESEEQMVVSMVDEMFALAGPPKSSPQQIPIDSSL